MKSIVETVDEELVLGASHDGTTRDALWTSALHLTIHMELVFFAADPAKCWNQGVSYSAGSFDNELTSFRGK